MYRRYSLKHASYCFYFILTSKLTENGCLILDAQSLMRNKILSKTFTIGAPSERQIPCDNPNEEPSPLVFRLPIPTQLESHSTVAFELNE
jgi:hypothetical protein